MKDVMPDTFYDEITRARLILSANRVLLCEVRSNMRKVCVEYLIYFFYDFPFTQEELDYDVEGTVCAEMSCDFPDEIQMEERSMVIPLPQRMPNVGICVFRRYEPNPEPE